MPNQAIDPPEARIVNAIKIRDDCGGCREPADSFEIPLCLFNPFSPEEKSRPNLYLHDLTWTTIQRGVHAPHFEAFGLVSTGVFGYEPGFDRMIQNPIEISGPKTVTLLCTEQILQESPSIRLLEV